VFSFPLETAPERFRFGLAIRQHRFDDRRKMGALVVLVFALVLYAAWRSRELFVLDVVDGRVVRVRGRIGQELLSELEGIVRGPRVTGSIRVRIEEGAARVHAKGLDAGTLQRVRNVVGRHPLARLRTASRAKG
jgi:hypothetical protein